MNPVAQGQDAAFDECSAVDAVEGRQSGWAIRIGGVKVDGHGGLVEAMIAERSTDYNGRSDGGGDIGGEEQKRLKFPDLERNAPAATLGRVRSTDPLKEMNGFVHVGELLGRGDFAVVGPPVHRTDF